jgi:hypothetical protein
MVRAPKVRYVCVIVTPHLAVSSLADPDSGQNSGKYFSNHAGAGVRRPVPGVSQRDTEGRTFIEE